MKFGLIAKFNTAVQALPELLCVGSPEFELDGCDLPRFDDGGDAWSQCERYLVHSSSGNSYATSL